MPKGAVGTQPQDKKGYKTVAMTSDSTQSTTTKKKPLKKHRKGGK